MTSAPVTADLHQEFLQQVDQAIEQMTFGGRERPAKQDTPKNVPRFRHILLAYDGSEGSQRALEWAKDLARAYGSKVTVATAFTPPQVTNAVAVTYAWYPDYADAYATIERSARKAADGAADLLRALDVEAKPIVVAGSAAREIARIASDKRADLAIVGATRAGPVRRTLLGSTAEAVLHRATCSVLVARGPSRPPRILAATDGSHAGFRAVAYALHRASQTGAELVVQHVLDYPVDQGSDHPPEGFVKAVAQRLALPAAPPKVRYVLDVGEPPTRILLRASEENAGLVVVGSQGKGAIERLFVGSTSQRVASGAHASVLVVKDPDRSA